MSAQPLVPQRPARSQDALAPPMPADGPKVPPRPTRKLERSISRDRENASRSPLNDTPFAPSSKHELLHPEASSEAQPGPLKRNPSVPSLPLIGQEGMEYASLDNPHVAGPHAPGSAGQVPQQVSNVAYDLPLHAPKASDAPGASLSKISAVTGHQKHKDGESSPALPSPHGKSRPPSIHTPHERAASRESHHYHSEDEHGIPSFGATVPMYPNAGDVQAPGLPSGAASPAAGVGFFQSGAGGSRPTTAEGRRRSLHNFHGPPGSYGLHGHGQLPHDKFEKDWYARHPEEVAKEEHALHGPAAFQERPEYAMSSDELNQLVRETSRPSSGMGIHTDMMGIPSEAIGYKASEDYAKIHPPTGVVPEKIKTRHSRPPSVSHVDSPLRKTMTAQDIGDEEQLHVDPPAHRVDKIGGAGYDPPLEDLGPKGGNTKAKGGWVVESGTGTPILASDETAKHPGAEFLHPAVSPSQMLSEDDYFSAHEGDQSPYRTKSRSRSRPGSRDLSRIMSHDHDGVHTPLEDIEEYEPLFEDEEDKASKKPLTAADRLKRPELDKRRFPSQDIWEDTPTSLQLETTVEGPQEAIARDITDAKAVASTAFEMPEQEQRRRGEVTESERLAALQGSKPKAKLGAHLREERPSAHRFPSQDVWEDTPDSLRLETTVEDLPAEHLAGVSPPKVPARPARAKAEDTSAEMVVPPKPQRSGPPPISGKPKPMVPQRPGQSPNRDLASKSPEEGPTASKTKPAVPARPAANSKFASIKAGFLNDLNSRIGLGPQPPPKPKEEEVPKAEEDKTPLGDARRGRARGPARRKPAVSPGNAADGEGQAKGWGIAEPWTVWSIATGGAADLTVAESSKQAEIAPAPVAALKSAVAGERVLASPLATNTAGEALLDPVLAPATSSGALAHAPSPAMDARAHRESQARREALQEFEEQRVGHAGDVPSPIPEPYVEPMPASPPKAAPAMGKMPGKETLVTEAPVSPQATQHQSPMDAIMDDEKALRSSETTGGSATQDKTDN